MSMSSVPSLDTSWCRPAVVFERHMMSPARTTRPPATRSRVATPYTPSYPRNMSRSDVLTGNVPGSMTLRAFEADLLSRE